MIVLLLSIFILLFSGCDATISPDEKTFAVLSYNVQNLFDATLEGSEYEEYQDPDSWDEGSYRLRLKTLSNVLLDPSLALPDIIVLQEVEGSPVVHDLLSYHLSRRGYRWYAVSKGEESPIAVAIISRHPVSNAVVHAAPGCRPFLEATVETSRGDVVVFALHAKSRIGGDEETEARRIALSGALTQAAKNHEGTLTLLCGDFNENPDAVWGSEGRQTALVDISHPESSQFIQSGSLAVTGDQEKVGPSRWYTPYLDAQYEFLSPSGSCCWTGQWLRYDLILSNGYLFDGLGWEYDAFSICALPSLLNSDGTPNAWDLGIKNGVSDHLPVLLTLTRR
ncbi:endonuclease/exonuclease/phosphatase family protein [Sphaerochaeta halotolerans]|jgi:endonuclease/exonuclease/phosphatase family metal-dependent hydrolase|uniref:Endonuclease/exonuclease/phosphatase domain-containing protein n=1 Tax=Sphaerochaeta halotolerans TaxID=2293840 RepID=A0A372MIX2_9SPIR|nr:endonuclease/exonuclease/phosphatase family protein [Sphaerochaeta halotolerans]MBG0766481.1 endonuclease/exonuclease/phosphatase family protein [Spirochaetaceae bacterium]MDK2860426.1 hypothetical protein [Sphaerochaeta sp.]MDN5334674.1 hypothetical protein [Sphaerochaeta sp.]MXI86161.1 hypothetical protein [Sphaerochaeta halotolerans]RFU95732.1 hypothetical protein DYP60_01610 [Sphaerochaeta halotolerans]